MKSLTIHEFYTDMLNWLKESVSVLPNSLRNVIVFNTLTGLRPDEGYKAMGLIKSDTANYVDRDRMLLLHYKYPDSLLRVAKNTYVSVINEDIIQIARNSEPITS